LTLGLKVQQLRALATEHRLTQRMIDHQHVALLIALPGKHRSFAQGFEEAL
jgi:formate dehydrogenase assembly factor FdhD